MVAVIPAQAGILDDTASCKKVNHEPIPIEIPDQVRDDGISAIL